MYATYIGASLISMTLVSVIIWATNNELQYIQNNWQYNQTCQYIRFSIKETQSPWSVMMTGNVIGNISSCNDTAPLHYFTEYDTSDSCSDNIPYFPPRARHFYLSEIGSSLTDSSLETDYNGLPADDKNLCNYTQLENRLTASLYRPFNCLVNRDCTRLEPWRSNDFVIKFYIATLAFEGLIMCFLGLCFAVFVQKCYRERKLRKRFVVPHPPYTPPPAYTMYMP